jgi:TolB-like protein/Tfp pilus assembly protein PilF
MAEERIQRRLAAILAADVVGYSRLMERDEAGTMATLKARRKEVLEPVVARHQGRIFKVTGDGVLVEFGSAVNAVQCAIDLQHGMAAADGDLPETRRIALRIGVNLGDVMVEGGDLYGDGVNVAARLEGIAEPGGVLISGTTFDHVRNKIDAGFKDIDAQSLKNIAEPVRAYRVVGMSKMPVAAPQPVQANPSIAVLPFINMSGDPEQQYFSDGLTEDIITELSQFRELFVIARNSSFRYRDKANDLGRIGRELGVQYIVEGSIRTSLRHVRITAGVVDIATGNQLWTERYDRHVRDIFAVQDEIAQSIAATVEGRVAASGAQRSRRKPTHDLVAYDYFLQGRERLERYDTVAAAALFRRAIELDPEFARAHALLSQATIMICNTDLHPEMLRDGLALAQRAVSLDESDPLSHMALGFAYTIARQFDLAGLHTDRAMELNPANLRIASERAVWLVFVGRPEDALRLLDANLKRDPFPPQFFWASRGFALFACRRYEESIRAFGRVARPNLWHCFYLASAHAHLGSTDQARSYVRELLRMQPAFTLGQVGSIETFQDPAGLDHLLEGLRKAGLPE